MMAIDERPTLGERYSAATESSNLKLGERRGDVDMLIAAGLVPDGFGLTLYRLMTEFDAVRGPVDAAKRWVASQMSLAAELRKQAGSEAGREHPDQHRIDTLVQSAKQVQEAAVASLRTEFILVLSVMRTLREAKYALGNFAITEAWRKNVNLEQQQVLHIAGRVLDVWLDPLCNYCEGRGYNGAGRYENSGPQVFCRPCKNTGLRVETIGKDATERLFAGHLLMQMDSDLAQFQKAMRNELQRVAEAKRWISEQSGVAL